MKFVIILMLFVAVGLGVMIYLPVQPTTLVNTPKTTPVIQPASAAPLPKVSASATPIFSLRLTDDELTSQAQAAGNQDIGGFSIRQPRVFVTASGVRIEASAANALFTSTVVAKIVPKVEGGKIKAEITSLTIAGLNAPNAFSQSLAAYVDTLLATKVPANVQVSRLQLLPGVLVVEGDVR